MFTFAFPSSESELEDGEIRSDNESEVLAETVDIMSTLALEDCGAVESVKTLSTSKFFDTDMDDHSNLVYSRRFIRSLMSKTTGRGSVDELSTVSTKVTQIGARPTKGVRKCARGVQTTEMDVLRDVCSGNFKFLWSFSTKAADTGAQTNGSLQSSAKFTERQMQEWYRRGYFDSTVVFSIHPGFFAATLADLIIWNGLFSPFSMSFANLPIQERVTKLVELLTASNFLVGVSSKEAEQDALIHELIEQRGTQCTIETECGEKKQLSSSILLSDHSTVQFPVWSTPLLFPTIIDEKFLLNEEVADSELQKLRFFFNRADHKKFNKLCSFYNCRPVACSICKTKLLPSAPIMFSHVTSKNHCNNLRDCGGGVSAEDVAFWESILRNCRKT